MQVETPRETRATPRGADTVHGPRRAPPPRRAPRAPPRASLARLASSLETPSFPRWPALPAPARPADAPARPVQETRHTFPTRRFEGPIRGPRFHLAGHPRACLVVPD